MVHPRPVADTLQTQMNTGNMSTEEFRDRLRKLCGVREGEGKRSNKCVVRKPTDRGYYPPPTKKGKKQ
jgi:hypothetical protein